MYTRKDVNNLIESKLKDRQFIIVSNREPYIHMYTPEGVVCKRPVGGLTAALDPLMQACEGMWIAGGGGDADKENVDSHSKVRVLPDNPKYILKRVWMSKDEVDKYYFGFSNQTLWPLCHNVFCKPVFKKEFWEGYKKSNKLFSDAIIEEAKGGDFIWFHDYHLALVPKLIRESISGKSAHFWHIPWPPLETFMTCPWKKKMLECLLANDMVGFYLKRFCINIIASVENILGAEVDYKELTIDYDG